MSDDISEIVREALKSVIDPELGYNIVDLGLVYEVTVESGRASVRMTLTTPGCPAGPAITGGVYEAAGSVEGIEDVEVDVVWDPRWTPSQMSPEAKAHFGIDA